MSNITRRKFILYGAGGVAGAALLSVPFIAKGDKPTHKISGANQDPQRKKYMAIGEEEWKKRLTAEQFNVLREEGTEPSGSSPLNEEKRQGTFHCVACDNPLFSSNTKFESGTGWPSFTKPLPNAVETKQDYKLVLPRTEYHCGRCGGHQGHIFEDGPKPAGLRYCNNGVSLKFVAEAA